MPSQTIATMEDLKNWENNHCKLHTATTKNLAIDYILYLVIYPTFDDIPKRKGIQSVMVLCKHTNQGVWLTNSITLISRRIRWRNNIHIPCSLKP
jgi:hypothetical protein